VAVSLLAKLEERKQEMANLRDRASAQANLKAAIIDEMLNGMPDEFSSEDIDVRAEILFRHVGGDFAEAPHPGLERAACIEGVASYGLKERMLSHLDRSFTVCGLKVC